MRGWGIIMLECTLCMLCAAWSLCILSNEEQYNSAMIHVYVYLIPRIVTACVRDSLRPVRKFTATSRRGRINQVISAFRTFRSDWQKMSCVAHSSAEEDLPKDLASWLDSLASWRRGMTAHSPDGSRLSYPPPSKNLSLAAIDPSLAATSCAQRIRRKDQERIGGAGHTGEGQSI